MTYIDMQNLPIQNPGVVAAIEAVRLQHNAETDRALGTALNKATFLVPVRRIGDHDDAVNQIPFQAGKDVVLFRLTGPDGKVYLPLFTDIKELSAWADEPTSGMVVPAGLAFKITVDGFAGCVINASSLSFQIPVEVLKGQPAK
jgi:hypothetical protein